MDAGDIAVLFFFTTILLLIITIILFVQNIRLRNKLKSRRQIAKDPASDNTMGEPEKIVKVQVSDTTAETETDVVNSAESNRSRKTKECKYCHSEINEKANVCPYCRKRQPVGLLKSVEYVFVFIVVIVFLLPNSLEKKQENINKAMEASPVTYENYCKVQSGMTYDQVCDLFGKEGKFGYSMTANAGFGDYTYDYYYWYAPDGSYCLISFIDNEVVVATQIGLEK